VSILDETDDTVGGLDALVDFGDERDTYATRARVDAVDGPCEVAAGNDGDVFLGEELAREDLVVSVYARPKIKAAFGQYEVEVRCE
jgi:hypothetical protein